MYRILIAGAGYTGGGIAEYFCAKKQKVWGITRTPDRKPFLEKIGATPIICDLTRPETIENVPQVNFVIISIAPDIRDEASYRKVYLDGTQNLLQKIKASFLPQLVIYISSTGVYPDLKGERIDETFEPEPDSERGKILLEAEKTVLNSGLPSIIFRLAGIYGPERNRISIIKSGKIEPQENDSYMNLIHVEDVVAAIPVLLKSAEIGNVYLGSDDTPVLQSEFYGWLCKQLGIPVPKNPTKNISGKRCSNKKLKSLGFTFKYPSFREGYLELLGNNSK